MMNDSVPAVRLTLVTTAMPDRTAGLRFGPDDAPTSSMLDRIARTRAIRTGFAQAVRSPAVAAACTAEALGYGDAALEPALRDRDYGSWGGQALDAVAAADPDAFQRFLVDPGAAPPRGESVLDLVARASAWLDTVAPGSCLAVTHPPMVRACLVAALGAPPKTWFGLDIAYGTQTRLTRATTDWRVVLVNGPLSNAETMPMNRDSRSHPRLL